MVAKQSYDLSVLSKNRECFVKDGQIFGMVCTIVRSVYTIAKDPETN